jgi:hypothetical protein
MYASTFNTDSFVAATLFIERLLQNEDHVFNLIDHCQNDSTLSLDLQLILEAAATEKQLEDKLGYKDNNVLRLHTIVITAIAAAIRHGILNTIRDSKKLPVVPDYIPSHFAGQGIVQYFEKFDAEIHAYGKKFPTSPRITSFTPIDAPKPHVVLNAKNSVTSAKIAATINVEDAFGGDQDTPPLIAKLEIIVGEKRQTRPPNIDHGDTIQRQEINDGRPSTNGQE